MEYYRAEIRNAVGTCIKRQLNDSDLVRLAEELIAYGLEDGDQIIIKVEK
jgi:hypothetical protein